MYLVTNVKTTNLFLKMTVTPILTFTDRAKARKILAQATNTNSYLSIVFVAI